MGVPRHPRSPALRRETGAWGHLQGQVREPGVDPLRAAGVVRLRAAVAASLPAPRAVGVASTVAASNPSMRRWPIDAGSRTEGSAPVRRCAYLAFQFDGTVAVAAAVVYPRMRGGLSAATPASGA